jgi:hypothetical protein
MGRGRVGVVMLTDKELDARIDKAVRIGIAAFKRGDFKTVGEARFWVMVWQAVKKDK